ncbi:MAG TPA: DUF364 domain-containing protein [Bacteroidales bacterium]|nr:DUF364 domain-containing protein [Bacteroidales bacterium]
MILNKAYQLIREKYQIDTSAIVVERVILGSVFTAVQITGNYCGLVKTETPGCDCENRYSRNTGKFSPGTITGSSVDELLTFENGDSLLHNIRLACMNALSSMLFTDTYFDIRPDRDAIDFVDLTANKNIVLVGAFQSYIKHIASTPNHLHIIEMNAEAIPPEYRHLFIGQQCAKDVLANANTVIMTGSVLSNNTYNAMLRMIPATTQILLVGPSGGLLPDVWFDYGVDVIATTRITRPETVFRIVSEGGSTYHLFAHECAQKICIIPKKER